MVHQTGPGETTDQDVPRASAVAGQAGAASHPAAGPAATADPATGEPRVDAALRLLDRLPGLPVSDHPELFEQVHAQLSEVLGELETDPAGGPGPVRR